MAWVAAVDFYDLKDDKFMYRAGEKYPRPGLSVSQERAAELAGRSNRAGIPLIKYVDEPAQAPEPVPEKSKTTRKRVKKDA